MKTSESRYCQCMYFTANALARKMEKLARESWKKVKLSPSHAYLLMIILEDAGVQPGKLADEMQLTPSTITRLIEKLEEKKLVVRTIDGKVTNVYPSPKAKQLLPELKACMHNYFTVYSKFITNNNSIHLLQDIHKLADKLPD